MKDKDFAPYPEALELKKLGFNEPCLEFYDIYEQTYGGGEQ